ncbi:MAG: ATP-binding cassette domain-containing protein [Sedimentisphaerales bacterium]|nr:ATP-binding cassette domain-containing protein [Sedimentisphaerales bacterium]
MALLGMQDASVGYGGAPLLSHMNLQIEVGERICLLGRNGVGKSTLMKLIAGELVHEDGEVTRSAGLRVASLSQHIPDALPGTVFDQVSHGLGDKGDLLAEYHLVSHRMATEADHDVLLKQLDELGHKLDANDGWQMNRHIEMIIERMKLDADAEFASLSAGMKRRVLLGRAIVGKPDILLLDEPTNHLDIDAVRWIEDFLLNYDKTLVFVSHDRAFLKKLTTRIVELDRGRLTSYACDYDTYLKRKEEALAAETAENAVFDKKLAQEEVWIRRGIQGRRTRNEGRVRALKQMRAERAQRKEELGIARMELQGAQNSGRKVIEAKNISFSYEAEKPIISGFSATIMRGDKIGIIGPNGSGKTTLLRVLLKELETDQGSVTHGTNLEIAYFDQLHMQLDHEKTVTENIADGSDTVMINGKKRHIVGYLQDFLFTPAQSRNPVKNLSGGERNRLILARMFTRPSNVLVLDEPTNDLDIETLSLLEELLLNYPGTVLMVSHDREFLNNVVTSTMVLEGKGTVAEYVGGYDDWLRQSKMGLDAEKQKDQASARQAKKQAYKQAKQQAAEEKPKRLTFKEKKELAALPGMIEELEQQQKQLHEIMAGPDFYKNKAEIVTINNQLKEVEAQLQSAYERWEQLETLEN